MFFKYILPGLILGAVLAGGGGASLLGATGGAILGALWCRIARADQRIRNLEARLGTAVATGVAHNGLQATPDDRPAESIQPASASIVGPSALEVPQAESVHDGDVHPASLASEPHDTDWEAAAKPGAPPAPQRPSLLQTGITKITAWFTHGNVPVKVGVIVSFIGVAFLLKYAIDSKLLVLPIEFRLLAVVIAGAGLLFLGWRLRNKARVYALSLQGGGAGILFLTIFAAFRIWHLIPATMAFGLLVALAVAMGVLAVVQSAPSLIVLGITGGFLAPVLASTGQGSHVALFSYYLILNAVILGVAWFRSWRILNLVGFGFTFVIGSLWGYNYYRPEWFASTEPFLVLYFLFYNAIAILFALRQPPDKVGLVDGTLVFGTPVIAFTLQAALLRHSEYGLAISAASVAVFYVIIASALFRRQGQYLRMLAESYLALAVAFATLAIPLALDARWTSAAWALEGAALVWVGTRQGRHLPSLAGAALLGFSGVSFFNYGWRPDAGWPVLNANVIGGLLISLGGLFAARRLESFGLAPLTKLYRVLAWALFTWGVAWWLGTGLVEINDRLQDAAAGHALLAFVAFTAAISGWLGAARDWAKARRLTTLYLPTLVLLALMYKNSTPYHFLFGAGWLAWPFAFLIQARLLWRMDARKARLAPSWHVLNLLLFTWLLAAEASWQVAGRIDGAWNLAVASAIPGIAALLVLRGRTRPAWPVPSHPLVYRVSALLLVTLQALYVTQIGIDWPGDPGPMRYVPVINPFDLAAVFALLMAGLSVASLRQDKQLFAAPYFASWLIAYKAMLALLFFIISTTALVRGVHHFTGVAWTNAELSASVVVQTSLSIYWGLIGFLGMVAGARMGLRWLWLAGTGFMVLVVLKLFLVDLGNSGTIERIISFIGIGILLLVVGYFAPAPPRRAHETASPKDSHGIAG
jgi:uncharacterized membrane protein